MEWAENHTGPRADPLQQTAEWCAANCPEDTTEGPERLTTAAEANPYRDNERD